MLPKSLSLIRSLMLGLFLAGLTQTGFAFTQNGTTYTTDGSINDINNAISAAPAGSIVQIPPGNFKWGTGGAWINLNNAVSLLGSGTAATIITIDPSYFYSYAEVIRMSAPATVGNFSIIAANNCVGAFDTDFNGSAPNGWRITNVNYSDPSNAGAGYFVNVEGNYGLIDNCTLTSGNGSCEWIFCRGPSNSWQTPSSEGTANCVIIESSTFNGMAYICDANANARVVVRYCTINGRQKIDGHGLASNSPARGVRHMEIYGNTWTTASGLAAAMELRGGSGYVFNNTQPNGTLWFWLNEYGCLAQWPNFGGVIQTPANYPIKDQIGEGEDVNGAQNTGGSAPMYIWGNLTQGANWAPGSSAIPGGAYAQYRSAVGGTTATFTILGPPTPDIIQEGRDYFLQGGVSGNAPFTGTDGIGAGTTAQMNAITPTVAGVGYWVTDQGSWNTTLPQNTSGQFYTWNGNAWVLTYTPYTFPDPMRLPPAPTGLRVLPAASPGN